MTSLGENSLFSQHFKGFAVGGQPQQVFVMNYRGSQDLIVEVKTPPDSECLVRILLLHERKNVCKVIGFTSVLSDLSKGEFKCAGRLPHVGQVYFLPLALRTKEKQNCDCAQSSENVVQLLKITETDRTFTTHAEEVSELLFDMLDSNYDLHLSPEEIAIFKQCLTGHDAVIGEDEWLRIISGWHEGDLVPNQGISLRHFKNLLFRLADCSFEFCNNQGKTRFNGRKSCLDPLEIEDNFRRLLLCFGISPNLEQKNLTEYNVSIFYARDSISSVKPLSPDYIMDATDALSSFTKAFGTGKFLPRSMLQLFFYRNDNFYAISMHNHHNEVKTVAADLSERSNAVSLFWGVNGIIWKEAIEPGKDSLIGCFGKELDSSASMEVLCKIFYDDSYAMDPDVCLFYNSTLVKEPQPPCILLFFLVVGTTVSLIISQCIFGYVLKTNGNFGLGEGDSQLSSPVFFVNWEDFLIEVTEDDLFNDGEAPTKGIGDGQF